MSVKPAAAPLRLPRLPCACAALRRASRAVTQFYGRTLLDTGLEITQFTLLQVLHRAGPLTQGSLGSFLAMDSTTLSRSLQPLEKKGWIAGRRGRDRRERHWRVTRAGSRVLERAEPSWHKAHMQLRRTLGEARWEALMEAADAATQAAGSL